MTAAAVAQAGLVQAVVTEPRSGEWTHSSEWGNSFQGAFPKGSGDQIQILNNTRIPGLPRSLALALNRPTLDRPEPGNADVYARVTYGSGAASHGFLVDWRGTLTLPANMIQVAAQAYAPQGGFQYDPFVTGSPTTFRLSATIGIEGSAPREPVTFTSSVWEVLPNEVLQLDVHSLARRVTPFIVNRASTDPLNLGDCTLTIIARNGVALAAHEVSQEMLCNGVPLPAMAHKIDLTNYGPAPLHMGAIFALGL